MPLWSAWCYKRCSHWMIFNHSACGSKEIPIFLKCYIKMDCEYESNSKHFKIINELQPRMSHVVWHYKKTNQSRSRKGGIQTQCALTLTLTCVSHFLKHWSWWSFRTPKQSKFSKRHSIKDYWYQFGLSFKVKNQICF